MAAERGLHWLLAGGLVLAAAAAAAQSLEERLPACAACHGEAGVSPMEATPSLAAQPSAYSVVQLYMFREGLRPGTPMTDVAKDLTDEDLQAFADHFAALAPPVPATDGDSGRIERGRALAQTHRCGVCHRPDFSGQGQVPRLAGQREDYLAKALREYKSGARPGYDPAMAEVMAPIGEPEIDDLAYFLARTGK
ncbi:c-type cytochrome [Inquilinus limosus]|uniref:c-type cytochrome n=1 Tax=Inquilinus limosus TaxID=171674 RepID=UPI003F1365DF